jgi:hypothetical protein
VHQRLRQRLHHLAASPPPAPVLQALEYEEFTAFDRRRWPKTRFVGMMQVRGGFDPFTWYFTGKQGCPTARAGGIHVRCLQQRSLLRQRSASPPPSAPQYDGDLKLPTRFLVPPPAISGTSGEPHPLFSCCCRACCAVPIPCFMDAHSSSFRIWAPLTSNAPLNAPPPTPAGEFMAKNGLKTFVCSETQKFGHVTFFWNGNRSGYFNEELETYVEVGGGGSGGGLCCVVLWVLFLCVCVWGGGGGRGGPARCSQATAS